MPCSLGYHFTLRGGLLHVTYFIRSCDFLRYFRDDVYMAMRLGQWALQLRENTLDEDEFDTWYGVTGPPAHAHHQLHIFEGDMPKMRARPAGTTMRPSCSQLSWRSHASSPVAYAQQRHVGAVVVKDGRIVSIGYNGSPPGQPHCIDVGCAAEDGCLRTIHAEANAVFWAARTGTPLLGATMYATHSPCLTCAQQPIIVAGIRHFIYDNDYTASGAPTCSRTRA